jgi:hypothetical protein
MTIVKIVSKTVFVRSWLQIEPKLLAVLGGLSSATALTALAGLVHYKLDPTLAVAVASAIALLVGYFKHSTMKTFPVEESVAAVADIVVAASPAIAPQVHEIQSVLAPAFETPFPGQPMSSGYDPQGLPPTVAPSGSTEPTVAPIETAQPASMPFL